MSMMRSLTAACLLAVAALPAAAQTYPTKPVRYVVPFAPGGTTDILARIMADQLSRSLGQQFVVENRAGAGGNIGGEIVAKAAPDGYTLLMTAPGPAAINQYIFNKMPYDSNSAFATVGLVATIPNVFVVHPSVPATTIPELIAVAKAKPGSLNYASTSQGSTSHLAAELFKTQTGTDLVHVTYRGSAPALQDLIAGQVQLLIDNLPSSIAHIRSGALRALAITSLERSPALPQLPTVSEFVPNYNVTSWFGVVSAAGTPADIVTKLNTEINRILALEEVKKRFDELGATAAPMTPQAFDSFIKAEMVRWKDVAERSGAKLD